MSELLTRWSSAEITELLALHKLRAAEAEERAAKAKMQARMGRRR